MTRQVQLKQMILDYLEMNRLMTVATCYDNKPWAATVFFAYDSDLNLYFFSAENTRKVRNLLANPKVAAAIDRFQPIKGKIKGIQLEGKVFITSDETKLAIFKKRYPWSVNFPDHVLFEIKPSLIVYLDEEKFGPQGKEEIRLD